MFEQIKEKMALIKSMPSKRGMFDPRLLIFFGLSVIILVASLYLGAGINEMTVQTVGDIVTSPSATYNTTIASAGTVQTTLASFINLPVIAALGALALAALFGIMSVMGMGNGGRF